MKPEHLKEAGEIVGGIAWIQAKRKGSVVGGEVTVQLPETRPNYAGAQERLALGPEIAAIALTELHKRWDEKEAKLRRRAAQIGLVL